MFAIRTLHGELLKNQTLKNNLTIKTAYERHLVLIEIHRTLLVLLSFSITKTLILSVIRTPQHFQEIATYFKWNQFFIAKKVLYLTDFLHLFVLFLTITEYYVSYLLFRFIRCKKQCPLCKLLFVNLPNHREVKHNLSYPSASSV